MRGHKWGHCRPERGHMASLCCAPASGTRGIEFAACTGFSGQRTRPAIEPARCTRARGWRSPSEVPPPQNSRTQKTGWTVGFQPCEQKFATPPSPPPSLNPLRATHETVRPRAANDPQADRPGRTQPGGWQLLRCGLPQTLARQGHRGHPRKAGPCSTLDALSSGHRSISVGAVGANWKSARKSLSL